ncbi:hypothetical protein Pyn_34687 [Prunus yedoensis var. nudiflora]|uniref:Uncharacterized protein n=1 Tax=Prunus yedoensis var. nudiflora TaxID=2094558 RepID=A0A314Y8P2_PRUYE|nr:hypothetical protein Pyn_34687 [Prunus yedoensis var. nudiflora]
MSSTSPFSCTVITIVPLNPCTIAVSTTYSSSCEVVISNRCLLKLTGTDRDAVLGSLRMAVTVGVWIGCRCLGGRWLWKALGWSMVAARAWLLQALGLGLACPPSPRGSH